MNRKTLTAALLAIAAAGTLALPPVAGAMAMPQAQTVGSILDYYNAARTILYTALAISGANLAFAYHTWRKENHDAS